MGKITLRTRTRYKFRKSKIKKGKYKHKRCPVCGKFMKWKRKYEILWI